MDYVTAANVLRHPSWNRFQEDRAPQGQNRGRLVLLTTKATAPYHRYSFRPNDILLLGRESAGVPDHVHESVDARLRIPLRPGARSLNVALAAAMVLGEALRQTQLFPAEKIA